MALDKIDSTVQLVFPSHLQKLVEKTNQSLFEQAVGKQSKLITNLKRLLTSSDASNIKIGLSQMIGIGIPNELMTAVLSFYLYHPDQSVRQIASQAFRKYAPTGMKIKIRSIWKANMRSRKTVSERIKDMKKICQDDRLSAAQMYIWVNCLTNDNLYFSWTVFKDKWERAVVNQRKNYSEWRRVSELTSLLSATEMYVLIDVLTEEFNLDSISPKALKSNFRFGWGRIDSDFDSMLSLLKHKWCNFASELEFIVPDRVK